MVDFLNIVSVCSGAGFADLGLHAAVEFLGYRPRVLAYCEREAYAASCLLARMEAEALGRAPVFCGDLRGLDARPMRGLVDVLAAGLPCQPYSNAGKRRGIADERSYGDGDGPLPHFLRIVAECQPAMVFLENVPPWVRGGHFRPFGEELCGLGYALESPLFIAAEDVGASHKRERVFILAHRQCCDRGLQLQQRGPRAEGTEPGRRGQEMADAEPSERRGPNKGRRTKRGATVGGAGREMAGSVGVGVGRDAGTAPRAKAEGKGRSEDGPLCDRTAQPGSEVVDASGQRLPDAKQCGEPSKEGRERESDAAVSESGSTRIFAPGPDDERWADILAAAPELAPAIESGVRVLVDGRPALVDAARVDQLRCAGNGCVPLQAAAAFVTLFREAFGGH